MSYPFVLGTAQLGGHYGITNAYGCPSDDAAKDLLKFSWERGIRFLDTAFTYGNSIERIIQLYSQDERSHIKLINKFSIKDDFEKTYENLVRLLEKAKIEILYGLLIHDPSNFNTSHDKSLHLFINKLKKEKIVQKVGISIYDPVDLDNFLDMYPVDLIQCPLNLFDQRILESDILNNLTTRKIEIHARSLFLQGVLLCEELPNTLQTLQPVWKLYQKALSSTGLNPLNFIMTWIKSLKGIDKWVIGVNNKEELFQILQAYDESGASINYDWLTLHSPHNRYIDPRHWGVA